MSDEVVMLLCRECQDDVPKEVQEGDDHMASMLADALILAMLVEEHGSTEGIETYARIGLLFHVKKDRLTQMMTEAGHIVIGPGPMPPL